MTLRPDEGRPEAITEQGEAGADDRHGDAGGVLIEFVGDVELTPAAAKVLLRILRKHATRQGIEDEPQRPVSASTDRPGATPAVGRVSPDGESEAGPLRLGTASFPYPTAAEGANTSPE